MRIIVLIICLSIAQACLAMGGQPPVVQNKNSKYKLEIINMNVMTSPPPSAEATCEAH